MCDHDAINQSKKLASVKHCMYHPELPSIRRMDRNDNCNMLPNQHSRTTTKLEKSDFDNYGSYANQALSADTEFWSSKYRPINNTEVVNQVVTHALKHAATEEEKSGRLSVANIQHVNCDGNGYEKGYFRLINPTGVFESKELGIKFSGYPMRQFKAEVNHGWVDEMKKCDYATNPHVQEIE